MKMSGKDVRGIVRIKPIYIGLYHYRYVYGSVCSPDVSGTPPIVKPSREDLEKRALKMVENFKRKLNLDFVKIDKPYIISEQKDIRLLPKYIDYDIDAFLVGSIGATPLEKFTLKRYGIPFISSTPDEDLLRALRIKKYLRESRVLYIGEIPSFSAPQGPWNFFEIERKLGVRFRHIETNEFYRIFDSIPKDIVRREYEEWRKNFLKIIEPSEEDLLNITRIYLTLKYLARREDANAITINCGRFTEERPIVPCLAFARLIDEGIICGCEGDITAILSSLILHAINNQPTLMGNFGYMPGKFEAKENEVTIEHDVLPASMTENGLVIRDYHGRRYGVTGYGDIKKMPVTLLNLNNSLDEMSIFEGYTKYSVDGVHCRVIIHIDINGDVKKIPKILVGSQHISMTYGHWLKPLKTFGKIMGIKVYTLN